MDEAIAKKFELLEERMATIENNEKAAKPKKTKKPSAYNLFVKAKHKEYTEDKSSFGEKSAKISAEWKKLSKEEKDKFQNPDKL